MSDSFFKGKRSWSKIKDQVLGSYLTPYLSKVNTLRKPIVLIDAFAGPGKFEDNTAGSPLIICQAAERRVRGKYLAIFVNEDEEYHHRLSTTIKSFIDTGSAIAIYGAAEELLSEVHRQLDDQIVFLYLDPFGLKGCEFSLLEPFVRRDKDFSTEIVINLSVPTMHRLATSKAHAEDRDHTIQILSLNNRLSSVLGGDYWQEIMWDRDLEPEERARRVVMKYLNKLESLGLPFTGSCPVREKVNGATKYYITFGSRHPHAMLLMNDAMCVAYHEKMHLAETEGTFFEGSDWRSERDLTGLEIIVIDMVTENPGINRESLWLKVVSDHFMRYLKTEYINVVKTLISQQNNVLISRDVRGTGRLNDETKLFIR